MRNTSILDTMGVNFEMRTNWFHLWRTGETPDFRVVAYDVRQAQKLNRLLPTYPKGTRFLEHEEPQFKLRYADLPRVMKILGARL